MSKVCTIVPSPRSSISHSRLLASNILIYSLPSRAQTILLPARHGWLQLLHRHLLDCPWGHTDLGHRLRRPSRHGLVLARYLRVVTSRRLLLCRNVLGLSYRGWPVQLGRHPCPASLRSRRRLGDGLVHVYWDRRNGSSQQLRQSPFPPVLFSHTTPPSPRLLSSHRLPR
jgi:hypothetical protein